MVRKTFTEKVLIILDALLKESGAVLYPYKGIGRSMWRYRGSLSKAIYDLKRRGYLEEIEIKGQKSLKLTQKGQVKILTRHMDQKHKNKKWDGLWRLISFDIEEKRRKIRDLLRFKLRQLGCLPIQKSLWITPYDISEPLEKLIDWLNLKKNVYYFISQAISNQEEYLKKFSLK